MPEIVVGGEETVVTTYLCGDCNAEDSDNGANPPAPHFLNCWNCGAGFGLDPQTMYAKRKGMFPVAPKEEIPN